MYEKVNTSTDIPSLPTDREVFGTVIDVNTEVRRESIVSVCMVVSNWVCYVVSELVAAGSSILYCKIELFFIYDASM